jgi:hypothetical protein
MSPISSQTLTSSLTNGSISKKDVNGTGENKGKILLIGKFSLKLLFSLNNSYFFSEW